MINEITKAIIAQKQAGAKKVRITLITMIERNGRKIPQVINIMECETDPVILKSGKLASLLRAPIEMCKGQYETFTVERLKCSLDINEDGSFERT